MNPIKVKVTVAAFCNAAGVDAPTTRLMETKFPESVVMQFSEADLIKDLIEGEAETPAQVPGDNVPASLTSTPDAPAPEATPAADAPAVNRLL